MPVKIQCPLCGTEMTVSDAAMGTTVGCPWCRHRFKPESVAGRPVEGKVGNEAGLAVPPPPGTPSDRKKPEKKAEEPVRPRPDLPSGAETPESGPPVPKGRGPEDERVRRATPPGEGAIRRGGQPGLRTRPDKEEHSPDSDLPRDAAALPGARPVPRPAGRPAPPGTGKKVARLILTQTAEPAWKLAPDGSLPSLHLQENTTTEKTRETKRTTNPLLLAILLSGSVLTSLALLFVDTGPTTRGSAEEKERARQELAAEYYSNLNPNAPLAEYQRLLREAHWAHSRGEYKRERELYRRVLLLLYAERGRDSYTGLTGSRSRDQRLEELLRILLKE